MMNLLTWTTERIDKLKDLWGKNFSSGQCADALGLTRNAVMGKVHRMGLSGHERPPAKTSIEINETRRLWRARMHGQVVPKNGWCPGRMPIAKPVEAPPLNIGFMKLKQHHCRWVTGKGDDSLATYCGHDVFDRSFCDQHYRVCYEKPGRHRQFNETDRILQRRNLSTSIAKATCDHDLDGEAA